MDNLVLFQKAVDALPFGVTLWEADSEQIDGLRLVYANPQASHEAGLDLQRFVGRPIKELLPEAEIREHGDVLGPKGLDAALRKVPHSVPHYQLQVGNEPRQFRVHLVPVWDRTVAMVYEHLRAPSGNSIPVQTRDFFEGIVKTLHEPLLVVDDRQRVVWSNQVFAQLLDASQEDLIGRELAHLTDSRSTTSNFGETLCQVLSRPLDAADLELGLAHGDNEWTMHVRARRLPGGQDGSASPVLIALRDVSSERSADALQRELVQKLLDTRDEERRRVARDLHDQVGQSLTLMAARVQQLGNAAGTEPADPRIARLLRGIASLQEDVARLAAGLHPLLLDELGFESAVRQQLGDFAKAHHLRVDVAMTGLDERGLEPRLALALYRMIQEGLTNVARHANATSVNVIVRRESSRVRVVLEDDGVGFDPEALPAATGTAASGLGLAGLRERATLLGGELEVESAPGGGTALAITLPAT